MNIFFTDPSEAPRPPDEVRIRKLEAQPYPDGRRVKVLLEVTPFQRRPNLDVRIQDSAGHEVASLNVVEPISPRNEFTMHLRLSNPTGEYRVIASVLYPDQPLPPPPKPGEEAGEEEFTLPDYHEVAHAEITFVVP